MNDTKMEKGSQKVESGGGMKMGKQEKPEKNPKNPDSVHILSSYKISGYERGVNSSSRGKGMLKVWEFR